MKIAFIGLGIMGSRMAANLLKSGVELTVFNRSEEPRKRLVEQGANEANSIEEAVADANIVFSMLSKPEVVREVMIEKGILHMNQNALWVDFSTVNPSFTQRRKKLLKKLE